MSVKVIGIGEVLWDLLPAGPLLGGAPANVAFHAKSLGADARVVTRIGNDPLGRQILDRFVALGLPTDTVQVDDQAPTGTVSVTLSGNGVPHFVVHEGVAWDRLLATGTAVGAVQAADAICFGSLAQRDPVSRAAIQDLVAAAADRALRVFDINLRQNFYSREIIEESLGLSNVLKLNDGELPVLARMFALDGTPHQQMERLAKAFQLRCVALTRGAEGSLVYHDGRWSEHRPKPVQVVDTIGAGDAFTAGLVMGLLLGMDLHKAHVAASEVARHVCSQAGATPPMPERLRELFVSA